MVCALAELHALERRRDALRALILFDALIDERQLYVLLRGELWDKVEALEHEAYLAVADMRKLVFRVVFYGDAVKQVLT